MGTCLSGRGGDSRLLPVVIKQMQTLIDPVGWSFADIARWCVSAIVCVVCMGVDKMWIDVYSALYRRTVWHCRLCQLYCKLQ